MAWWIPILALFKIPMVGSIIAGLLGLFLISIVGIFIPSLQSLALGIILLLAAYFIPDATIIKTHRVKIGLRNILGLAAVMSFILMFFNITPASFGIGTITSVASVMPAGSITDNISASLQSLVPPGVQPTSLTSIMMVFVAALVVVFILNKISKKRRR